MGDYRITLSENGKYVICQVKGLITKDIALEFTKALHRFSLATGVKRFLSDVREAQNTLNPAQNYIFAYKEMTGLDLQRDVRSAILTSPDDSSHDFVETVSQNAGFNVRLFHDENAAIQWLAETPPRQPQF